MTQRMLQYTLHRQCALPQRLVDLQREHGQCTAQAVYALIRSGHLERVKRGWYQSTEKPLRMPIAQIVLGMLKRPKHRDEVCAACRFYGIGRQQAIVTLSRLRGRKLIRLAGVNVYVAVNSKPDGGVHAKQVSEGARGTVSWNG